MARQPRNPTATRALRLTTWATWTIGVTAAGALTTACTSQVADLGATSTTTPTSAAASQSYVISPPPGAAAFRSESPSRSSPTTQPSAPDCIASHLDARFLGGGFGTGNDFGEMVIWNPGPQPCQLHGRVGFAGYYADGSQDRNAVMEHPMGSGFITLPGTMPPPRDGQDTSDYLVALLMGPERDDATQPDLLCRPQDEGTPAALVLSIGSVTVRTTNKDPRSVQITSIYGCHGRVLLEDLHGPQQS
jgi:hypothetical protein